MQSPEAVVRSFCTAWERRDIPTILDFFSDDAVYHNMPLAPVSGKDGIEEVLHLFVLPAEKIRFEILHLLSQGNLVLTERVDHFTISGKEIALPVAGVFELRDGKIVAWRDYFDFATWQRASA